MNQETGQLLCALRYNTVASSYPEIRKVLVDHARRMAASAMNINFYCSFATFPRWTNPGEMQEFAVLSSYIDLADIRTLCVSIRASPIDDILANSVFDLLPEPLCLELRAISVDRTLLCLERAAFDSATTKSLKAAAASPLGRLVDEIFSEPNVEEGLLAYGMGSTHVIRCERACVARVLMMHLADETEDGLLLRTM